MMDKSFEDQLRQAMVTMEGSKDQFQRALRQLNNLNKVRTLPDWAFKTVGECVAEVSNAFKTLGHPQV